MPRLRNIATILLAAMLLFTTACRKKRNIEQLRQVEYEVSDLPADSLFLTMADSYLPWHDIFTPVTIVVEQPAPFSISGRLTMTRDSLVHISLRAMGMEVAVIYADTDSVFAVDKYHKLYVAEPLSSVLPQSGLDLGNIQDLLLGRAFMPAGGTVSAASLPAINLRRRPDTFTFSPASPTGSVEWMFRAIACVPAILNDIALANPAGTLGSVTYGNHAETPVGGIASALVINAAVSGTPVLASVSTDMDQCRFDTFRRVQFKRPDPAKYRRIPGNQLIRFFEQ